MRSQPTIAGRETAIRSSSDKAACAEPFTRCNEKPEQLHLEVIALRSKAGTDPASQEPRIDRSGNDVHSRRGSCQIRPRSKERDEIDAQVRLRRPRQASSF